MSRDGNHDIPISLLKHTITATVITVQMRIHNQIKGLRSNGGADEIGQLLRVGQVASVKNRRVVCVVNKQGI